MPTPYDALLIVSFGGPESQPDVLPFLENVLRGRNVPPARLLAVAEHYRLFGGRSPLNDQCRALIEALRPQLKMPIYWGNRNWHPFLEPAVRQMQADGVRHALALVTSAYSSYSACRQYLDDIEAARGPAGPEIDKLGHFFDHPEFIAVQAENLRAALSQAPGAAVLFTAHSIPTEMALASHYVRQLETVARLTAAEAGVENYRLVYQSRSGAPGQSWLGPDILEALAEQRGAVVVAPIGFLSDHMEVIYDLDYEAAGRAVALGMRMVRAATPGTHPRFIRMLVELIEQRQQQGSLVDPCRAGCCEAPFRTFG
jgi:ferrochelatase